MVALSELLGATGAGGSVPPIDGVLYLNHKGPVVTIDGAVFLRSGFVNTDLAAYPDAASSPVPVTELVPVGAPLTFASSIYDIELSPDGTKLYVCGHTTVEQYTLAVPFDVASAIDDGVSINSGGTARGVFLKPDGTRIFLIDNNSSNDRVRWFDMATPFDLSTASYVGEFGMNVQNTQPNSLFISPDGINMYVCDSHDDQIEHYEFSTPWLPSSAAHVATLSLTSLVPEFNTPSGISFDEGGGTMLVGETSGSTSELVQFSLSMPWDLTTAQVAFREAIGGVDGLHQTATNDRVYISVGGLSRSIQQYTRPQVVGSAVADVLGVANQFVRIK